MDISDSLYIGLIATFFAASLVGMALIGAPQEAEEAVNATGAFLGDLAGDPSPSDGQRFHTVCLGSGCIPPLDTSSEPASAVDWVKTGAVDWMEAGDRVVAVSFGGGEYAVPLKVLRWHAVVNTEIAGTPLVVTYSPYSGVPAVFRRNVGGRTLTFEHAGKLYNGNMVMQDRETGTGWSQFLGKGLTGELAGQTLEAVEADIVRWGIWRRNHPQGTVLSRQTGIYPASRYLDRPYFAYRRSTDVPFQTFESDIHPKEVVYGVSLGDGQAAYRAAHVRALDLIQDELGGELVLLVQDEARDRIRAFSREVGGEELSFTVDGRKLRDAGTNSTWRMDGTAVSGPMAGAELEPVDLTRSYWFTWKLFYPETKLYTVTQ